MQYHSISQVLRESSDVAHRVAKRIINQEALRERRPPPHLVWESRQCKNESCIQGIERIITNHSWSFFMSRPTYPENFMKIQSCILRNVANRHDAVPSIGTVEQASQEWDSLARCFVLPCPTYPENFMKIHQPVFTYPCYQAHINRK